MKKFLFMLIPLLVAASCNVNQKYRAQSPWGTSELFLDSRDGLKYAVLFDDDTIVGLSPIDLAMNGMESLGRMTITGAESHLVNRNWERTWGKNKKVTDHCMEHTVYLENNETGLKLELVVRAYENGVAFRYSFPEQEGLDRIEIAGEHTQFRFTGDHSTWMTSYDDFRNSQEQEFPEKKLSETDPDKLIGMPLLVKVNDNAWCALTEANLTDWSGAFLKMDPSAKHAVSTVLAPCPDEPGVAVKRSAPAVSPWRVVMLGEDPGDLIESNIIANLNDPVAFDDVSWIRPGVSAWDWWWCNRYAPSAGFELGPNQETMKYFIDFASEMGWEYQIVDWQWYGEPFADPTMTEFDANPDADITTCIDGIDIPSLVKYADSKNVKLVIWLHWWHLQRQMDEALPLYEKWGVAGIKVDFMDRQDQEMVRFYHEVARKAGEHHLVVDFHGAYRPTGVSRTYPNLITREGVLGNEYTKWSDRITPEHNVTLPFTRGLLGEMDFTPAAFRNVTPEKFLVETETPDGSPVVQTTRCHQLAMTVVFESAFGVFCDSPDNYRKGTGLDFLRIVPTTWKETQVLNAEVADYVTIARRSGDDWFVGSMTDSSARELEINLSFLGEGTYRATIWEDAEDAGVHPINAVKREIDVTGEQMLTAKLAPGGGQVIHLEKVD